MRAGCGKIFIKSTTNKAPDSCLSQITNNIPTKSQVRSEKADRLTQIDSFCSKQSSRLQQRHGLNSSLQNTFHQDLQENLKIEDPGSIVRKLSSLNIIFKQLKMLKECGQISYQTIKALSKIQDKFIGIEREILKNTHNEDSG